MNELRQHKKSDKIKWVLTGIAFVLVAVMLTGICLQLFGTGKQKPSEWFNKSDTEQTAPVDCEEENGEVVGTPTASKVLYSTSPMRAAAATSSTTSVEIFHNSNTLDDNLSSSMYRTGKGTTWLTENSYDSFVYTARFLIGGTKESSYSVYKNDYYTGQTCLEVGNLSYRNGSGTLTEYCGVKLSCPEDSSIGFMINCGDRSVNRMYLFVEITDTTLTVDRNVTYPSTSKEYKGVRNFLLHGKLTLQYFSDHNYGWQMYEEISLYENRTTVPLPPDPVKEGHTFVGWYYDSAFTRPYDNAPIYEDTDLYAKFTINKYTVTFDSNGGSTVASKTVDWNTAVTLTTPTRDRHAFKGWYLPNGTQYTNQAIKQDTTLTARWERNVFSIAFDTDGGTEVANIDVNLNASIPLPTVTKTGYNFVGWFMQDGTQYTNQAVTDDMTLTAHWEIKTFSVKFYVDNEVYVEKTVEYGQVLVKVAEELNLTVLSVRMASGAPFIGDNAEMVVTDDTEVVAEEKTGADKVINTVEQNKWAILGGVGGGLILLSVLLAVCNGVKRKKY